MLLHAMNEICLGGPHRMGAPLGADSLHAYQGPLHALLLLGAEERGSVSLLLRL